MEPRHCNHLNKVTYWESEQKTNMDTAENNIQHTESFGQLVGLGYDVTAFTPAPYQRPSLGRPS